jgi:hypothetical protein
LREEEPKNNPFPWRKIQLEEEWVVGHSNMLVEACYGASKG